jgi:outer membrane protein
MTPSRKSPRRWLRLAGQLLLPLLLLQGRAGWAQAELSYPDCLQRALQDNVQVKQYQVDLELAQVQLQTKRAGLLPIVTGLARNNTSTGRSVDPLTNQFVDRRFSSVTGAINGSVFLFDGLATINAIKTAKQEVRQNTSELQALRNDLTIDVAVAYTRINFLQELLRSRQQQVEASALLISLTRLKLAEGTVAENVLYKLLSQQATEQLDVVNTRNDLAGAYLELRQLMNVQATDSIRVRTPAATRQLPAAFAAPAAVEVTAAVEAQPALAARQYAAAAQYYQIAVSRANRLPTLQFTGNLGSNYSNTSLLYDFNAQLNNNMTYGVGFVLTVPLFNRLNFGLLVKESRLRYQRRLLEVDQERNRLTKVIAQAVNDARAASLGWQAADKAEEYARRSYATDQLKYEHGTISVFELTQSKLAYTNAQTDLYKAKYEFLLRSGLVAFYQGQPLGL